VAPARRTRPMVSRTRRCAPRAVFALPLRKARMEDLASAGAGGDHGVIAPHLGVAEGRTLLVVAVDLADRGVDVDGHRAGARASAGCPRPGHHQLGHPVELADVAEGEAAQEGAERGRCHHPVAEDLVGRGAAQDVGIVDEVPTGDHRVHQGHHLAPRKEVARAPTQVDAVVDHGFEAQGAGPALRSAPGQPRQLRGHRRRRLRERRGCAMPASGRCSDPGVRE